MLWECLCSCESYLKLLRAQEWLQHASQLNLRVASYCSSTFSTRQNKPRGNSCVLRLASQFEMIFSLSFFAFFVAITCSAVRKTRLKMRICEGYCSAMLRSMQQGCILCWGRFFRFSVKIKVRVAMQLPKEVACYDATEGCVAMLFPKEVACCQLLMGISNQK